MAKQSKLPISINERVQKLKLCNEKLEVIRRGRFLAQLSHGHQVAVRFGENEPLAIEKCGADEEAVLALVTTLRFFCQPGDGISIAQLADIYEDLPVEERARQGAREAADSIERYLDSETELSIDNKKLTNRHIFEVILYGGLAHANDNRRPEYELWMKSPAGPMLQWLFDDIAAEILRVAISFYQTNQRTIMALSVPRPSGK
jgi:hypothetical protein